MKCSDLILLLEKIIEDKGDCSISVYGEGPYGESILLEADGVEYLDFQNTLTISSE